VVKRPALLLELILKQPRGRIAHQHPHLEMLDSLLAQSEIAA
jgi:hypothetical protein